MASHAELVNAVNDIYISRLFSGCAATFVVYDWFLVFGDEFATIYRSSWSMPKLLFFYIRVVTPPGIILGTFQLIDFREALSKQTLMLCYSCKGWAIFVVFAMLTSLCCANGLLTLRLIALYKRKRSLSWFIGAFYVSTYIATFTLTILSMIPYFSSIFYSDALHLCGALGVSSLMPAIWYAPAAFETFVFSMTAYRAWEDASIISSPSSAPLLTLLYRDGMISFVIMGGIRIWNIWICTTRPPSSFHMGTMILWATNTVLTTRVYMNLVWLVRSPSISGTAYTTTAGTFSGSTTANAAAKKMRTPVDSYAYGESHATDNSSHPSRNVYNHTSRTVSLGKDVPMEVWKVKRDSSLGSRLVEEDEDEGEGDGARSTVDRRQDAFGA